MRRVVEFTVFTAIALGLHIAALTTTQTGASLAAGGETAAGASIAGAASDLNDLIESWDTQPESPSSEVGQAPAEPQVVMEPVEVPPTMAAPTDTAPTQQALTLPPVVASQPTASARPSVQMPVVVPPSALAAVSLPLPAATPPAPEPDTQIARAAPENPSRPEPDAPATIQSPREAQAVPEGPAAPIIASMPRAKPTPPEAVVRTTKRPAAEPSRTQSSRATKPEAVASRAPAPAKPTSGSTGANGETAKQAALAPGAGGKAETDAYTASQVTSARKAYLSAVRRAVLRKKRYPRRAERRGITGKATVRVTLDAAGNLVAASLTGSAGAEILDEAAMAAIKRVGRYPPIPKEMGRARVSLTLPIRFQKK